MRQAKITILFFLLSSILFSQERMILRTNGEQIKIDHKKDLREAITESRMKRSDGKVFKNQFLNSPQNIAGVVDTVNYRRVGGAFNTNFGFFGQDVMMMWFEAQADMNIKALGFTCSDDTGAENATVSLRLVKLNWTKEQLQNFNQATQIGYYPSSGDGFNETDYFGELATGEWVSKDSNNVLPPWTNNADPAANTWDYDLWSEKGFTSPITPVAFPNTDLAYIWRETVGTGDEPSVSRGEIFAVVATHDGITLDEDRIGFWSDNTIGYPGWKFYENGRSAADTDPGWWVRMYTWDFAVAVDFTSCPPPRISITPLTTAMVTDPRDVCAEIDMDFDCYGGRDSVRIELITVVDKIDTNIVEMTSSDNYFFCAQIAGQSPSTSVEYWVQVTDNQDYVFSSRQYSYKIFKPEHPFLFVFNGYTETTGYPQEYYFGGDYSYTLEVEYDSWSYGPLTKELVDNYEFIFEICTSGPNNYNGDVIRTWLEEGNSGWGKWYILAGDDWLDLGPYGQPYQEGDFEYDILGITDPYFDVSYDGTSGQELPSKFFPQEGSRFGDPMFKRALEIDEVDTLSIDSIRYDPIREIGLNNWHDGFEIREDDTTLEVFMKAETRGIGGAPIIREVNVGISRRMGNNKIMFMSYDPISINSSPTYHWFGRGGVSSQRIFLGEYFNKPNVDDDPNALKEFSLSQNYPNPFNPSTTIKYSIPGVAFNATVTTTLKIYDILGREIATLVNKKQKAGNYEVQFNAKNLTSGIYFYKLQSGNFVESRKMLLLK